MMIMEPGSTLRIFEPLLLRRKERPVGIADSEEPGESAEDSCDDTKPGVRCAGCYSLIAYHRDRISVDGASQHTFLNPAGIVFSIELYRIACGCVDMGSYTAEYTWFPAYSWRYAACLCCGTHLGWRYRLDASAGRNPESFFGLISEKLLHG